jgi:5,10-methenyltetrahydrofolate synthetase
MRIAEFGIAVPAHGRPVQPECLLIPCVGFDVDRHRLGYGAGFYDRTLTTLQPRPRAIGIAFDPARVPSIEPHDGDRALDLVITDAAIY